MTEDTSQTSSPRRQRNRERTIETILETARTIMRENGVAGLSMQELARRSEMRAPSLYNYFSGLLDIYDRLFRSGFESFHAHVDEYVGDAVTWQEKIRRVMEAYMTFAMENPELYQLCFERPVPGFVPSEESMQVSLGSLERLYAEMAGLKEMLKTDLPPQKIADLVIAISHGLTAQHMANEPDVPPGEGRFGSLIPAAISVLEKAWS